MNMLFLDQAAQQGGSALATFGMFGFWILIFVALYFIILRPQKKKQKEEDALRNSIEIGDDVTTIGGIVGRIIAIREDDETIVIETGSGNCHIYVDKDADIDMAVNIIFNAKTQRIGVCNACESLVVHKDVREALLPKLAAKLKEKDVEIRGDKDTKEIIECVDATEEDFGKEYLDYIISVKTVDSVEEAIAHINKYNTGHSDCIITENDETAEKFLKGVDAACVYRNVSTRFTDGFEFGLGAEIGISTQKLHARGPMGLNELTSYKYKITGNGQVRG